MAIDLNLPVVVYILARSDCVLVGIQKVLGISFRIKWFTIKKRYPDLRIWAVRVARYFNLGVAEYGNLKSMNAMIYISTIALTSLITLLSIGGCSKTEKKQDDTLSLKKTTYTGNQLRIDGYYYTIYNNRIYSVKFLFENGVFADFGSSGGDLEHTDTFVKSSHVLGVVKRTKFSWGLFLIEGSDIKMEQWHPSSGGSVPAYVRAGKILNDSTFQMTESYRMQGGEKTDVSTFNELYKFHEYSPKPDSTNSFIP